MEIGIIRERGGRESDPRAILLPPEVRAIVEAGHTVFVEAGTGEGLKISDSDYAQAGASIVETPDRSLACDLVVKLKALSDRETVRMKPGAIALVMLHAEQSPENARNLAKAGAIGLAMENICDPQGDRYVDCTDLTGEQGMLFAFHLFPKSPSECKVLIMGYGRVSSGAIDICAKLGANFKILRKSQYPDMASYLRNTDILVNGITWPKEKRDQKEYVVTREMLQFMNRPAMIVDLSVDYPNPVETCKPTDMKEPTYEVDDVVHMGIYGYPALVPLSSSSRYSQQLLPIILEITSEGLENVGPDIARAIVDWRE